MKTETPLVIPVPVPLIRYQFVCVGADGREKWRAAIDNLVTTAGKNDLLDKYFAGSAYSAAWYVGLIDNTSWTAVAAADTMASHGGWIEAVPYSNATRPAVTWGAAASGSKAASTYVEFTINAGGTIRGAFLSTGSAKSGTTGILYSAAAFASTRTVLSGDLLRVTPTMTGS